MPRSAKIFLALTLVASVWIGLQEFSNLFFSNGHHAAVIARLPVQYRQRAERTDLEIAVIWTVIWSGGFALFALLAAFAKLGWSRVAFAVLFVLRALIPALLAVREGRIVEYFDAFLSPTPMRLFAMVPTVLLLFALLLAYSRPVGRWIAEGRSKEA